MSFTLTSPFASISGEAIEGLGEAGDPGINPDISNEEVILEEFAGDDSIFEVEDLDPLSALEKYCRSDMPAQRLSYAAGIGAAAADLEPSAISGSLIALLRELLGDVYADVRLTALQQAVAVARRLREPGLTYQTDIETLWDLVQPLLLDAEVETQEVAAQVLAELTHLIAWGNNAVASQKLVWAVQRLQHVQPELMAEGAVAALRLITEVVHPRQGSPLCFAAIESFAVQTFKDMASCERSADVRQAVALLLPRFVRYMPAAARTTLLPGVLKTLAHDTHWNVRAEVPDLLINLLAVTQHQHQQSAGQTSSQTSSQTCFGPMFDRNRSEPLEQQQQQTGCQTSHTAAAVGSAAAAADAAAVAVEGFSIEERKVICDVAEKLCKDASQLVKVPALAALGQLLPLLPAADLAPAAAAAKSQQHQLLALFASTAKPQAAIAGVKVPLQLCAPRLSGKVTVQRRRRQQQQRRRPGKAVQQQQQQQDASNVAAAAATVNSGSTDIVERHSSSPFAQVSAVDQQSSDSRDDGSTAAAAATGELRSTAAAAAADHGVAELAGAAGVDVSLLEHDMDSEAAGVSANATAAAAGGSVGDSSSAAAAAPRHSVSPAAAAVADVAEAAGVDLALLDNPFEGENNATNNNNVTSDTTAVLQPPTAAVVAADQAAAGPQQQQQQQDSSRPHVPVVHVAPRGTAAAELPLAFAFHIGKVARHVGSSSWPVLQPAFLTLAAAAVAGDADTAAALLLSFPDLSAALGPAPTRAVLVPVILELLHNQLEQLAPVLSVMLYDITAALPADLRICLLQLLPSLAIQPDRELAGDWRARLAVAQQLPALAAVLTPPQVAYCVWPLLLTLAKDPVHAVRAAAAVQVGPLLMQLPDQEVPAEEPADASSADVAHAQAVHVGDGAMSVECANAGTAEAVGASATVADVETVAQALKAEAFTPQTSLEQQQQAQQVGETGPSSEKHRHQQQQQQQVSSADSPAAVAAGGGHSSPAKQQQQVPITDSSAAAAVAAGGGHSSPEKQQQQRRSRLGKVKKGLLHGLQHLHQQLHEGLQQGVDLVKEAKGLQHALKEVDNQLQWLQQQPSGSVLRTIGETISSVAAAASGTGGGSGHSSGSGSLDSSCYYSLGELQGHLNSMDIIESAVDPCRYLPTPSWTALAVDLSAFAKAGSSTERQAFVMAAGSILAAHKQRTRQQTAAATAGAQQQQQQPASSAAEGQATAVYSASGSQQQQQQQELQTLEIDQLLHELQQLAADPVPGVRCGVAAVAGGLLAGTQNIAVHSSSSSGSNQGCKIRNNLPGSTSSKESAYSSNSSADGVFSLAAADVDATAAEGTGEVAQQEAELDDNRSAAAPVPPADGRDAEAARNPDCSSSQMQNPAGVGLQQSAAEKAADPAVEPGNFDAIQQPGAGRVPANSTANPAFSSAGTEAAVAATLLDGAAAVLEKCLQQLQQDPCAAVADMAGIARGEQ